MYVLGSSIGELGPREGSEVWDNNRFGFRRVRQDNLHGKRIQVGEWWACKVPEALRIVAAVDPVARPHAVHAYTMVQVVPRDRVSDVVYVRICREALDAHDTRTGEPRPVEADRVEIASVVAPEEGDELHEIRDDIDVLDTVDLK